jgi:photosystem II stability/assembly factor-like uncharacterized protein
MRTCASLCCYCYRLVRQLPSRPTSGTWQLQSPLPTGQVLHGVDLVSPSEAWAVGEAGLILHTTDGSVSWAAQNSATNQQLNAVRFLDSQHGWAAGGVLLYTTDGGQTWVAGTRTGNLMGTMYSVDFVDTSNGWAVGTEGGVLRSTDGGHTWQTHSCSSRFQRCNTFGLTSQARATSAKEAPSSNRLTAASLNSFVNCLRDILMTPFSI